MDVVAALMLTIVVSSVTGSLALFTRETGRLTTQLDHEATHDRLTDLLNRRGWDDATEHRSPALGPWIAYACYSSTSTG